MRSARHVRRLVLAVGALAVALVGAGVVAPSAAYAASSASSFVSLINSARASHGLAAYAVRSDLTSVAQGQAQRMASSQKLYHNPSLATQVKNWKYVGENVGYGPDVTTLWNAFMASQGHRDNILDHQFTQVGVGAVTVKGTLWVSMVFRMPYGSSAPTKKAAPKKATPTNSSPTTRSAPRSSSATPRATLKPLKPKVVLTRVVPRVPDGVSCLAGARVAHRVRDVGDIDRSARLVDQTRPLVLGFQCGSRLPMTGVLDVATLRALAATA
jgi:hypothetical protein